MKMTELTRGDLSACGKKKAKAVAMRPDGSIEVSRGHSSQKKNDDEGPNLLTTRSQSVKFEKCSATDKKVTINDNHDTCGEVRNGAANIEELQAITTQTQERVLKTDLLMERVVSQNNLQNAVKRVMANKGAPGIDDMRTTELRVWMKENEEELITQLLTGIYQPMAVKRVTIPKPGGGTRDLGIPTVVDRMVQQAVLQVMNEIIDPTFSESSYGFRPGKSAHQALEKASVYVQEGYEIVVDIDLEKFFDKVNHDVLMSRVARRIQDKRVLKLIRAYLNAGIMINGICFVSDEGTPQGGPLSPLLANVLLDDLDKELEKRGHRFCRYADDCNIYVATQRAGERVMASVKEFLEKRLRLKINESKSAVGPSKFSQISWIQNLNEWRTFDCKAESEAI